MKTTVTLSILLTGLMAAAGMAQAQTSMGTDKAPIRAEAKNQDAASATSNVPNRAGEASTVTNGAPNKVTSNPAAGEMSSTTKSMAREGGKNQDTASATGGVPGRAGEASSMVNGVPNADPRAPQAVKTTRAERKAAREMKAAQRKADRATATMGQRSSPAGANATLPAGSPGVKEGGTPN